MISKYLLPWSVVIGIIAAVPVVVTAGQLRPIGNEYQITLDAGTVPQGDVIRPCLKIENYGDEPVRFYEVGPIVCGGPARKPYDPTIAPGESKVVELAPIDTRELSGPISKSRLFLFPSPEKVVITAYASCSDVDH